MQRHLSPEWIWVEDIEGPDRGGGPDEIVAARADHSQADTALTPVEPGESPDRSTEPKDEWTVVPNRCDNGCDCKYCVEEAKWGQESY